MDYYQEFLGRKDQGRVKAFGSFLKNGHILTVEQHVQLVSQYNKMDVKEALFSIDSTKSTRPDGYSGDFFNKAWSIVEEDVTEVVLEFLSNGKLLKQL